MENDSRDCARPHQGERKLSMPASDSATCVYSILADRCPRQFIAERLGQKILVAEFAEFREPKFFDFGLRAARHFFFIRSTSSPAAGKSVSSGGFRKRGAAPRSAVAADWLAVLALGGSRVVAAAFGFAAGSTMRIGASRLCSSYDACKTPSLCCDLAISPSPVATSAWLALFLLPLGFAPGAVGRVDAAGQVLR